MPVMTCETIAPLRPKTGHPASSAIPALAVTNHPAAQAMAVAGAQIHAFDTPLLRSRKA